MKTVDCRQQSGGKRQTADYGILKYISCYMHYALSSANHKQGHSGYRSESLASLNITPLILAEYHSISSRARLNNALVSLFMVSSQLWK